MKKQKLRKLNENSILVIDHTIVGLTHPEIQQFTEEVIQEIARITKKLIKYLQGSSKKLWTYIDLKNRESIEMHRRIQEFRDEAHGRNLNYLRSTFY